VFESFDKDGALHPTKVTAGEPWSRKQQKNLLSKEEQGSQLLSGDDIKTDTNKAFDLLGALSRSGSLPIVSGELHAIVRVRHCFEQSVMDIVIRENINPIDKMDFSTLLLASTIHKVNVPALLHDSVEPPTLLLKNFQFPPVV